MTKRMTEVLVGVFVAAGFAGLFVLAMQVSNLSTFKAAKTYTLIAYFDNIGGLKVRSPVTVSGVRVGRVADIRYSPDRYRAQVSLAIDSTQDFFPVDTSASIYTSGLLGEQYVALDPGGDETMLKDGDVIEYTQSALVLEQLIGRFITNVGSKE